MASAVTPGDSGDRIRLSKLMARRGLCSRREADQYIESGLVRVDGEIIDRLGTRVNPDCGIRLESRARRHSRDKVTILLNKPVGIVSGSAEDGYRPAVALIRAATRFRNDTSSQRFQRSHLKGLAPAGRLDIESQGLLVLTQDGRIARRLIGPEAELEKEYLVRVRGEAGEARLQRLRHGLELDGRPLKPAGVEQLNDEQLRIVLIEGKKRQIRRMCTAVGLEVTGLKRVRIGQVRLGNLPEGQWRYLSERERF